MSITNLQPLRDFLVTRNLDHLVVGELTLANGSCFVIACRQNMEHLASTGQWNKPIPTSAEELRAQIIQFMRENKNYWTRPRFNEESGRMEDPPLEDAEFQDLINDQAQERAWTDNMGISWKLQLYVSMYRLTSSAPTSADPSLTQDLQDHTWSLIRRLIQPPEQHSMLAC